MTYSVIALDAQTSETIFAHGVYRDLRAAIAAEDQMRQSAKTLFSRPTYFLIAANPA